MNESENHRPQSRNRRLRATLTIRRDDHIGDRIGTIFLDPVNEGEDGIVGRVRDYLGRGIRIIKLELSRAHVDVEVESLGLVDESKRLSAAAEDLRGKGARRSAQSMLQEALKLDPMNGEALSVLGLMLAERGEHDDALRILRRAREIAGDRVDVLQSLAQVCVQLERVPSAIGYLERALEMEANNDEIRTALVALGRTPAPIARFPRRVSLIRGGRK